MTKKQSPRKFSTSIPIAGLQFYTAYSGVEHSHHLHTDESWLYVSNGSTGCVHRKILSWSISNKIEAEWCVQVLKDAVARYGKPDIVNSDQGSQYTGRKWSQYVDEDLNIKISTDDKDRAPDNR